MGQVADEERAVVGRIGYERAGDLAELWDPELKDFKEERLREGLTSPFALDRSNLVVIFQLRSGRIEHHSFTGAFRALLNEASGEPIWGIRPIVQGVTWERWRESVTRVRHLEVRLERPNPNYQGRDEIERIIEGAKARMVRMVFDAQEDEVEGLNLDDEVVHEAIEHARADYGNVKAVADIDTEGGRQESVWRSDREGAPLETRVPLDPETREARREALVEELPDAPAEAGQETIDEELRSEFVAPPPEQGEIEIERPPEQEA